MTVSSRLSIHDAETSTPSRVFADHLNSALSGLQRISPSSGCWRMPLVRVVNATRKAGTCRVEQSPRLRFCSLDPVAERNLRVVHDRLSSGRFDVRAVAIGPFVLFEVVRDRHREAGGRGTKCRAT